MHFCIPNILAQPSIPQCYKLMIEFPHLGQYWTYAQLKRLFECFLSFMHNVFLSKEATFASCTELSPTAARTSCFPLQSDCIVLASLLPGQAWEFVCIKVYYSKLSLAVPLGESSRIGQCEKVILLTAIIFTVTAFSSKMYQIEDLWIKRALPRCLKAHCWVMAARCRSVFFILVLG